MHTRRTGGDNGYQAPEDFANEGRGYQPANRTDINSVIHDRVDNVADNEQPVDNDGADLNDNKHPDQNDNTAIGWNDNGANWGSGDKKPTAEDKPLPEERNRSREGYDNGSNVKDDVADDQSFAASTGKMS